MMASSLAGEIYEMKKANIQVEGRVKE